MTTEFLISVSAEGGTPADLTDEMIARFVDVAGRRCCGCVSGCWKDAPVGAYGLMFDVQADDHAGARAEGVPIFESCAAEAGLPSWPVAEVEVWTVEEFDRLYPSAASA